MAAVLVLLVVNSLLDLYRANLYSGLTGEVPAPTRLSLSNAVHYYLAQHPVVFPVGAIISALSLLGVIALVIDDLRSRRALFVIPAVYTAGVLQPATPLNLPDGTLVRVEFDVPEGDPSLMPSKATLPAGQAGATELAGAATVAVQEPLAGAPAPSVIGEPGASAAYVPPDVMPTQKKAPLPGTEDGGASPWKLPPRQASFLLLFVSMIGLVLFLRLFKLETLQREIYGDIVMVRNYVAGVLAGHWPTRFDLSAGPLYHYLIVPVVSLTGLDYAGLKLASVIVSLGALAATYALSRRLINDYFALLTTLIAGVSSWLLIFSRLGNSQILLPLLTAASLWLVVRVVQLDRRSDLVACAIVSTLGLYVYPQSFVLPVVIFLTLLCLGWTGLPVSRGRLGTFLLVAMLCAIPFVFIAHSDIPNFTVGYIGSKVSTEGDLLPLLGRNIVKAMLAFHVSGDEGFRSNPAGLPHLDWISGVLFLGGILFWFTSKERRRWIPLWLVPFFLLQVPSIVALNQPHEVPSASRTLGIAPIVYLLVASGLWWLIQIMRARGRRWPVVAAVAGVLLGGIVLLNAQRYFRTYISGLPYQDTPIGRLIADYADALPGDTQVYMVGCCWEYSIPDRFVDKEVARPQNWHYVEAKDLSCLRLQFLESPAVFVWSFRDAVPAPQLETCRHWLPAQLYTYRDRPAFYAAPLRPDLPAVSADANQLARPKTGLEVAPVEVEGQTMDLVYSKLDMGSLPDLFDDNVSTLVRGLEANPFVLEFHFTEPRSIRSLGADFATMDFIVTAKLYPDERTEPRVYTQEYRGLPADPHIDMMFDDAPAAVEILRLEVLQLDPPTDVHIHVREVKFR
jgi:4-amino-4-deoxy-L-arabinose transferase-like glycosyltransferase